MELFTHTHIFSVTELTKNIRSILEKNFPAVCVEGEISNVNIPTSGHTYFTLKDKNSQLNAVLFKGSSKNIKFDIKDGLHIICLGRITVYQPRGQYQIVVEQMEPKGVGSLQLAFQQLKDKLKKEGLFDKKKKKEIPFLPTKIGVVTSSTGKAIRDILNVINRRFSNVEILLFPVKVQGKESASEITNGIKKFSEYGKVDVLIIGRGGGSLEDLWGFNEEIVARTIYESDIPIISAVGHEPDVTISDLVADLRAPTPSAAAELVVGRKEELLNKVQTLYKKLHKIVTGELELLESEVIRLTDRYFFNYPESLLLESQQKLDQLVTNMNNKVNSLIQEKQEKFRTKVAKLESLSPLSIFSRGYSITTKLPEGKVIRNIDGLKVGHRIRTKVKGGEIESKIEKLSGNKNKRKRENKEKPEDKAEVQKELFK